MTLPLRTCPNCEEEYPATHFRLRNDPVTKCRACRRRDSTKKNMRKKRALFKMLGVKQVRAEALKTAMDYNAAIARASDAAQWRKVLKKRFNAVTGIIRTRIKTMEYNPHPSKRTLHALDIRKQQLARYEAAYAQQLELVAMDRSPRDILEYMD